ncbi:MAG: CheR family methyltransferase [Arenimonas sp.]
MSREALIELLQTRLGLDPSTLGPRVVDDAFADARRALTTTDDDALYRRVLMDDKAFSEFSECFVVPETWFFRAPEQFQDLVRFAREQPARRPLRVLSLPSSTGEEAYSAAIALLEAGFAPTDIDVLGIDVSQVAIRRASAGVFRRSALRGQPIPSPWLHEANDGSLEADPVLRRCVRMRVGNALDPNLLRCEQGFDVLFCRNLLIYLLPAARVRLLQTLLSAARVPALVLAGQAEVLSSLSDALRPYEGGCPLSFVYGVPRVVAAAYVTPVEKPRVAPRTAYTPATNRQIEATKAAVPALAPDDLTMVRQLADAGHVDQARTACLARLVRQPADVETLYLLGLVESAAGNTEAAERAFTQVLYLDNDHLDAIEQRVGLAERRGASEQARDLRARASRLRLRGRETTP